jgi:hypothetical protein
MIRVASGTLDEPEPSSARQAQGDSSIWAIIITAIRLGFQLGGVPVNKVIDRYNTSPLIKMSDTRFDKPSDNDTTSEVPRESYDAQEEEYDADRLDDEIEALERSTFGGESGGLMEETMSGPGL